MLHVLHVHHGGQVETEVAIADNGCRVSRLSRAEALPLKAGELLMSSRAWDVNVGDTVPKPGKKEVPGTLK